MKASRTSLINVIDVIKLRLDLTALGNNYDSTFYKLVTKNTAYTSGGALRGDTTQSQGTWTLIQDNWVPQGQNHAVSDFEIPLDIHLGWPINGNQEKDSLHMKFRTPATWTDATYGDHAGVYWKWFKVRNGVVNNSTVTQPASSLQSGSSASWELVPDDDTMSIGVEWYWDGTKDNAFVDKFTFTKTMPVAGQYTLRVDQILYDTTYVKTYNVDVPITTTINGSASVSNSVTNNYSVSVSGGTSPYSYQWFIDGSPYTTSSSFSAPYWTLYSDHHLEVAVSDGNSGAGYAELWVFVSSCDPEDPNCQVELRASPTPKYPPPMRPKAPRSEWRTLRASPRP